MVLFIPCYPPYSNDFIGISEGKRYSNKSMKLFAVLKGHSQRVPVLLRGLCRACDSAQEKRFLKQSWPIVAHKA